jgi:hypothetical protein
MNSKVIFYLPDYGNLADLDLKKEMYSWLIELKMKDLEKYIIVEVLLTKK